MQTGQQLARAKRYVMRSLRLAVAAHARRTLAYTLRIGLARALRRRGHADFIVDRETAQWGARAMQAPNTAGRRDPSVP